ncbi:MAG TPA: hypothetical protein PLC61_10200 [Chitinophagales bacterium]|nr:hypothetical protein [Chitinophagales bacterium]
MGSYLQSYIGPYFKIKKKTVETTLEYKCCNNKNCEKFQQQLSTLKLETKFCPECGCQINIHSEPYVKVLRFWDSPTGGKNDNLIDISQYDEHLIPGHHIVIPNLRGLKPNNVKLKDEEDDFVNILYLETESINIEKDIQEFKENCSKHLIELQEFYGSDNIETHWGIFQYYD